ncbi:alpha/beta fold hydrolase [Agrobacterium rosae]|uniref:alpha/beta fold hydrolase n=1 Tax=Agrobacterium rosae TaxID=1972867 RepID=UPI003A7FF8B0
MRQRMIKTKTLNMNILEAGEGPLVVLCHGFPETSHAWRHQIAALAEAGFHAVAPDMRGYGQTETPQDWAQFTVFDLVADMVALVDALGEDKATIIGNDWGATIAWQAALLRPDRFHKVVAMGVPLMGQPPVAPSAIFPTTDDALLYALYFQQDEALAELDRDPETTLRKIYYAASGEAGPRQPGDDTPNPFGMVSRKLGLLADLPDRPVSWLTESDWQVLVSAFTASGFMGGLNYYKNLDRNWQLQHALSGLKVIVPALFMVGERDTGLAIPGMKEMIDAMPSLAPALQRTQIVPGAGHWLPQEAPDVVNKAIIEFLNC